MTKKLAGVQKAVKKDGTVYYRASITFRGKHISLGSFASAKSANVAYLEAGRILADPQYLPSDAEEGGEALSYQKKVSLINFRDNKLYIANPIYIRKRYFEYHYAPGIILKFDQDDLFYYSSHKIQKRGGRFFVADYALQTGIGVRYGIKTYAVEGRDYRFVNGDPLDFRYENIEVLNTYTGVSFTEKNGQRIYTAKIHLNGDFVIGRYKTPEEAAIAYNKAVDIVKKAGVTKQYVPNYMENISPSEYADIYARIKISDKIRHYSLSV